VYGATASEGVTCGDGAIRRRTFGNPVWKSRGQRDAFPTIRTRCREPSELGPGRGAVPGSRAAARGLVTCEALKDLKEVVCGVGPRRRNVGCVARAVYARELFSMQLEAAAPRQWVWSEVWLDRPGDQFVN